MVSMGEVARGGRQDEGFEGADPKGMVARPVEALRREVSQEVSWRVTIIGYVSGLTKIHAQKIIQFL